MYVIKKDNGERVLNIVVETKGVENQSQLRGTETAKLNCAEVFFNQLVLDGYTVQFKKQLNNKTIRRIVDEVLSE